ncbi:FGGY-family carbohydrate kinase [Rhodobacterales bacterium]|nr:FGGY-family carbohydrate kinase [Rhodobacterales bacterium]
MTFCIGVDVGTGSARAGVFDGTGRLLGSASRQIRLWHPKPHFAQQSSEDIWSAVCYAVQTALRESGVSAKDVQGIGFDATCSLVVADKEGAPVSVSPDGAPEQDIILWADHRAIGEAARIDQTGHQRLAVSGGTISPEMQLPKLLWLKSNLPDCWTNAAHFFDLPDWLTWRASGSQTRSLCSTVCKWTYRGEAGTGGEGWDREFFSLIGLGDLVEEGFARIGTHFASPATPLGHLTETAAADLGLTTATKVAASMIDAHAGALGTFGVNVPGKDGEGAGEGRMALIAGTSACHITLSALAAFVPGVWGPYYGAVLPELWVNEAGQSMAGAAIDQVLNRHAASAGARKAAEEQGTNVYSYLEAILAREAADEPLAFASRHRHILPDFNGNRAPLADPNRLGVTWGQGAGPGDRDLALDYLACVQALAYGTRHILDQLDQNGVRPSAIVISGGLARNRLYCQTHADVTGLPVMLPEQEEPVLLGSAMLAAVGAGGFADFSGAMAAMSGTAVVLEPATGIRDYHDRKYRVFRDMHDRYAEYRDMMTN